MHPVFIRIGPVEIRYYGLMYVIAIITGYVLFQREVKRKNLALNRDEILSYAFRIVVGGLLGARIYYVLFTWKDYYASHPLEIFAIWHGGLAIHGGIIGGALAAYIFARVKQLNYLELVDMTAPLLALGQAFGRFGNFMNGDAYGIPTRLPWGVVFPPGTAAGDEFPGQPLHPVMLYELGLNLISFFILWKLRKGNHRKGFIFLLYLLNYGVIRFFVSFFRADSLMMGRVRAAHVISAFFIVLAVALILIFRLWMQEEEKQGKQFDNN